MRPCARILSVCMAERIRRSWAFCRRSELRWLLARNCGDRISTGRWVVGPYRASEVRCGDQSGQGRERRLYGRRNGQTTSLNATVHAFTAGTSLRALCARSTMHGAVQACRGERGRAGRAGRGAMQDRTINLNYRAQGCGHTGRHRCRLGGRRLEGWRDGEGELEGVCGAQ